MTQQFVASIAIVSGLALIPDAMKAQESTQKNTAQPKSNQVYVKIVMPTDSPHRDDDTQ